MNKRIIPQKYFIQFLQYKRFPLQIAKNNGNVLHCGGGGTPISSKACRIQHKRLCRWWCAEEMDWITESFLETHKSYKTRVWSQNRQEFRVFKLSSCWTTRRLVPQSSWHVEWVCWIRNKSAPFSALSSFMKLDWAHSSCPSSSALSPGRPAWRSSSSPARWRNRLPARSAQWR